MVWRVSGWLRRVLGVVWMVFGWLRRALGVVWRVWVAREALGGLRVLGGLGIGRWSLGGLGGY